MEKYNKNKKTIDNTIKNDLYQIYNTKPILTKNNSNSNKYNFTIEINKQKPKMKSKTERGTIIFNNIKDDENYSIELDKDDKEEKEEEEEFNSDEYISSTMLDVDTNTYINDSEIKSNTSVSNININNNRTKKNSPLKSSEKNNNKKLIKYTYRNNNEKKLKIKKNASLNSSGQKNKNNNYFSSSPKITDEKNKDIFCKKLKIKNVQNNTETANKRGKKQKVQKDLRAEYRYSQKEKEKEKDAKNYSMGYKATLNASNNKDNPPKLDYTNSNININYTNLIKNKINTSKYGFKKIKLDMNTLNIKINEKNKTCKHKKSPTMINNNFINKNYNNIKDIIIMQKNNKINDNKFNKKFIISPKMKKIGIKSMKTLNSTNTFNHIESPSISIPNNNKYNRIFYFNTNNNTTKNNNTINIHNNINNIINVNNIKNINHINNIIFSPLKNRLDKNGNRNTTPSYRHNPFNSNSISIEINNISNCKNNSKNKISDKLLTYNCQEQKLLSRNKTFKNKRYLNKFLNLIINKNKMNSIGDNDIIKYKKNTKRKSPDISNKIHDFKSIKENIIDNQKSIQNQKIHTKNIGIQKLKNKKNNNNTNNNNNNTNNNNTNNNYFVKYSKLNSYSNRKQFEQFNSRYNLNKKGQKPNTKQFIYIKKDNLSNIPQLSNKKNYENNPFNKENKSINNKNISASKSKQSLNKELNGNMTSVNLIKNTAKNKKIKLEIGCKKKNKYRAKTLIEEDYLRDLLINNKDTKQKENESENKNEIDKDNFFKDYKYYKNNNNKSVNNNISINNPNNSNNVNYKCERKSNNVPLSTKDMTTKTPLEKHDINFNININMNNNNYKKLIYYYHAHNNSSINYSYMNQKERNSNISYNQMNFKKKKDNDLTIGTDYSKRNSNQISKNEYKLNKKLENKSNYNFNNNNSNEISAINNVYNNSENTFNSFNNNYVEECCDNFYYDKNRNHINNNNMYITRISKKQIDKSKNYHKINYIKKQKRTIDKNFKIENNSSNKDEFFYLDRNNTYSNNDLDYNKNLLHIKGNSNAKIKISNKNTENNRYLNINKSKSKKFFINKTNKLKNQKQKNMKEIENKNEITEPYDEHLERNLATLDNYICNYYYGNDNDE